MAEVANESGAPVSGYVIAHHLQHGGALWAEFHMLTIFDVVQKLKQMPSNEQHVQLRRYMSIEFRHHRWFQ